MLKENESEQVLKDESSILATCSLRLIKDERQLNSGKETWGKPSYSHNHIHSKLELPSLPSFEGDNPREWIRKCNKFFRIHQVEEIQKMDIVEMYLMGKADNWFQSIRPTDPKLSWAEVSTGETSSGKEFKVEASLSSWLKREPVLEEDGHVEHNGSTIRQNFRFGRTPADWPILGMVAAHWNDEPSQVSPKWWDGNGIPNSTNKYKEDQRVNWHATPFEERLEKALSEEPLILQRYARIPHISVWNNSMQSLIELIKT